MKRGAVIQCMTELTQKAGLNRVTINEISECYKGHTYDFNITADDIKDILKKLEYEGWIYRTSDGKYAINP